VLVVLNVTTWRAKRKLRNSSPALKFVDSYYKLDISFTYLLTARRTRALLVGLYSSDPKVCTDAELSQAVHRGERRVDADRHRYRTPADVEVIKVKVVLKE
jgi:hypothetical protein